MSNETHSNNFITVLTFSYPHEVVVVRGLLESAGITCFTKDELTVQVHNFHSNAIGGIKLQVPENQLAEAQQILHDAGHINLNETPSPDIWSYLNKWTKNIPWLRDQRVEVQFLVLIGFVGLVAAITLQIATG